MDPKTVEKPDTQDDPLAFLEPPDDPEPEAGAEDGEPDATTSDATSDSAPPTGEPPEGARPDWVGEALADLSPEDRQKIEPLLRQSKKIQGMDAGYSRSVNKAIEAERKRLTEEFDARLKNTLAQMTSQTQPAQQKAETQDPWNEVFAPEDQAKATVLRKAIQHDIEAALGQRIGNIRGDLDSVIGVVLPLHEQHERDALLRKMSDDKFSVELYREFEEDIIAKKRQLNVPLETAFAIVTHEQAVKRLRESDSVNQRAKASMRSRAGAISPSGVSAPPPEKKYVAGTGQAAREARREAGF